MDPNIAKTQKTKNAAADEKSRERELWFKTVVKVLTWKDGPKEKQKEAPKITSAEWAAYCKQTLKNNGITLKSKTQARLKEAEELIKKHGGFAN